jgi:putative sterol carrier protein
VNGVFEMTVKTASGSQTWILDLKKEGQVISGSSDIKSDVSISLDEGTLVDLATGKLNGTLKYGFIRIGQKAFMQGKLKVKGQVSQKTHS